MRDNLGSLKKLTELADGQLRFVSNWKGSIEISTLDPKSLAMYAGYCAWTLARAHSRSGDRAAIAAYLGGKDAFDQAIADFSAAYADKNERDFARLEKAAAAGQIVVERGFKGRLLPSHRQPSQSARRLRGRMMTTIEFGMVGRGV